MTIDARLALRPEQAGTDITCSGRNEGHEDQQRDELQSFVHQGWPRRVEGSVGASAAKTSNPRGLCIGWFSEVTKTRPRFPPTRTVIVKTAAAHWGLSSVATDLFSQFSRLAADALRILAETDPLKLLGRSGIGRSATLLRCSLSSDSSILLIQTIQRG